MSLYPLKFKTILKDKIWGGDKLKTVLNKDFSPLPNAGESWEISGVEGDVSVVSNGFLAGNNLEELIEIYMGDLVGDKVYEKFGVEFPLLIKFIDANDVLSIQVHPDDEMSKERHNAYGKTEMWYVIEADKGSELIVGFNQEITKEQYLGKLKEGKLEDILNSTPVKEGSCFFIPAGRVHAIGKGILLAEIQQTSDVTYRMYDFNRTDDAGNPRELHTELAVDAIDYSFEKKYETTYKTEVNKTEELVRCQYFTTNILEFDKAIEKDYYDLDSFVIYMCLEGDLDLAYDEETISVAKGESILIPATIKNVKLSPKSKAKILEVFIK
ncbi:class I mannose-6-phosphate isomerase [Labilibaculum sp. DW002]|jgi:mannose-6-phosphate isomerase|uniref:Phosphohexomutase n=1 Tax=Paralabilibaculum antarcticum TaxID=2912572 RepID=A0ABT5VRM8_9BACT|nr:MULTISPECIES: type I phosphomannose isomerase catalytic subunit [unclassified Labilibaculum]MBI9056467.1 class I mannose-6-phosphate isomerase [Labilibaculum sp.]MDE5418084.1 class I mannose-6-phosphate isomerase [Labilibaculum sp. DW002]